MWSAEIHRSTLDRENLAGWHVAVVALGEVVCIHIEHLVVGGIFQIATQVVVVVVRLVDDGWLVGGCLPSDVQRITLHNLLGRCSHNVAGESVFTVGSIDL